MAEPGRYPPPNFSCPTQEPVLRPPTFQWTHEQQDKFQASRDWNWFPSATAGPWSSTFTAPFSSYGNSYYPNYDHHRYSGSNHQQYRYGRQGDGNNQWGKKQKKRKEPEFCHFCDTCDRGFKNQAMYDEHIAQHVKCSVTDCSFTAHEKIVKIHWKNSHAAGAKRIKLDTPEEIAKWREERRKNYPTLSNVEKKMKSMEAKEKRGDVLETAQFGRYRPSGRGRGGLYRGGGVQDHRGGVYGVHQSLQAGSVEAEQPPPRPSCLPQPSPSRDGDPLGVLASVDPDSEREDPVKIKHEVCVAPRNMTSAMGSLMSSYAEDMSVSDEEPDDTPVLKAALVLEENKALLVSHSAPAPRYAPPPHPDKRSTVQRSQASRQPPRPADSSSSRGGRRGHWGWGRRGGRGARGSRNGPRRRWPTLLEMLLAPDIRHERNVVLQCIRYIIRNGFFGLTCKDSDMAKAETETITSNGPMSDTAVSENGAAGEMITGTDHSGVTGGLDNQAHEGNLSSVSHGMFYHKEHSELCLKPTEMSKCCQTNSSTVRGGMGDAETASTLTVSTPLPPEAAQSKEPLLLLTRSGITEDCSSDMPLTVDQPGELPEAVDCAGQCQTSSDAAPLVSARSHRALTDDEADIKEVNAAQTSTDLATELLQTNVTQQDQFQQTIREESSHQQLDMNHDASTADRMTDVEKSKVNANEVMCPVTSACEDDIWESCTGTSDT